jgi:hypothetical protein
MKILCKLTALAVCVALLLSLASCADFGVGENEDDFKKYFSGVYVLSKSGAEKYSIEKFNRDIHMEDMDIPIVVPYNEYCYIGFRVSEEYTISVSEFAFFARTLGGEGELELEFYITDKMPTSIKDDDGNDVDVPELDTEETQTSQESETDGETNSDSETETEIREEDLFIPTNKFHTAPFSVGEEWDSVLLEFDGSKTIEPNQYVIVRVGNNCYFSSDDEEEEKTPSVSFTFNYLLFHITDAHKK